MNPDFRLGFQFVSAAHFRALTMIKSQTGSLISEYVIELLGWRPANSSFKILTEGMLDLDICSL